MLGLGFALTAYSLGVTQEIWDAYLVSPSILSVPVLLGIRAGFIAIIAAVLYGISMIAYELLNRIIAIQDGKLRLSEISILVKDAVEAAVVGKGYSKDDETAMFIAYRTLIIKEFLSGKLKKVTSAEKESELKPIATSEVEAMKLIIKLVTENAKAAGKANQ
jgi:hypothetical protein